MPRIRVGDLALAAATMYLILFHKTRFASFNTSTCSTCAQLTKAQQNIQPLRTNSRRHGTRPLPPLPPPATHDSSMSALNLRSPDLATAYNAVLSGDPNANWALFSYSGNDLKVSATGKGGLEELQEEFSDGRIQYAFARVVDPNVSSRSVCPVRFSDNSVSQSKLSKFVQINWLGDGVPEARKGVFCAQSFGKE